MNEVIASARRLLKERTDSLRKDVSFCVLDNIGHVNWPAPFPALLYCFSTIDLLGALYWKCTLKGKKQQKSCETKVDSGVTNKSLNYMIDFMSYPELEATLIQKVFRHKLVHLAHPLPVAKYGKEQYEWCYHHNERSRHLKIDKDRENGVSIFQISIWSLVEDIVDSVLGPNGYLHCLSRDTPEGEVLRKKYQIVYRELYENNG